MAKGQKNMINLFLSLLQSEIGSQELHGPWGITYFSYIADISNNFCSPKHRLIMIYYYYIIL